MIMSKVPWQFRPYQKKYLGGCWIIEGSTFALHTTHLGSIIAPDKVLLTPQRDLCSSLSTAPNKQKYMYIIFEDNFLSKPGSDLIILRAR